MPIEFVGFTADRRITGVIPLADDRAQRHAQFGDPDRACATPSSGPRRGRPPLSGDVTLARRRPRRGVVGTGRRGSEIAPPPDGRPAGQRRLGRYTVSGCLHVAADRRATFRSPATRRRSSPDATSSSRSRTPRSPTTVRGRQDDRELETILVNRARANWIEVQAGRRRRRREPRRSRRGRPRTRYVKDFTGAPESLVAAALRARPRRSVRDRHPHTLKPPST